MYRDVNVKSLLNYLPAVYLQRYIQDYVNRLHWYESNEKKEGQ